MPKDVDHFISAEIPDPQIDPDEYRVVYEMIMHGPCGAASLKATYEIKNYVEGHFVCAHEAYWRILKFNIYRREPAVQILSVHLEDMQRELQKVNHVLYPPYKATCKALDLLGDDKEWEITLEEACGSATPEELRFTSHDMPKRVSETVQIPDCHLNNDSLQGYTLYEIEVILNNYDEAPMNDRRCFEVLDRTLRDILNKPSSLFGGKSVLLGGDFWKTLLVKKGTSKMEVIASCICDSQLWSSFKIFTLEKNMRLSRPYIILEERSMVNLFASWLLDVGDRKVGQPAEEHPENTSWIDIPPSYCMPLEDQDVINSKVLDMVPDNSIIYMSQDEATPTGNDGVETKILYPVEHLNTLKLPGFPPHHLELKVGAPVMLLRNVNLASGLYNGTRMIVRQLMTKLVEVMMRSS
ncbi:DNA helicase [Tanacetum coccineum]